MKKTLLLSITTIAAITAITALIVGLNAHMQSDEVIADQLLDPKVSSEPEVDISSEPTTLSVYVEEYLKYKNEYELPADELEMMYLSGEDSELVKASKTDNGYEFFKGMDEVTTVVDGETIKIETLKPTTMGEIRQAIEDLEK